MMDYGGSLEKLTTPEVKEFDSVFPGENWFFYWKTSPSLWEVKLRTYQGPSPIYVPIYWALHSEYMNQYDFGQIKPETDLRLLLEIGQNLGLQLVFLLPLGPAPFLTNGGVPSYLSRTVALGKNGMALGVWSNQSQLNKMYSYFDPQVFQSFRKFCWHFGQYLSQTGMSVEVFGLNSKKIENHQSENFFSDRSSVFDKGFNRYVKQLQDTDPVKVDLLISDPTFEESLKLEYENIVFNLYKTSCEELLSGHWEGLISTVFIAASQEDLLKRSNYNWESESFYFEQLFDAYSFQEVPSSILISPEMKKGSLKHAFGLMVTTGHLQEQIGEDYYAEDASLSFKPLYHFHLMSNLNTSELGDSLQVSGLKQYLDDIFPWQYNYQTYDKLNFEEFDENSTYFFFGKEMSEENFSLLIKLFLNGQKIFLDKSQMSEKLSLKLDDFFVENKIQVEAINYLCPIQKASIGDGLLITFVGSKLAEQALNKRLNFWEKMISFLEISSLKVQSESDIYYFWSARASNAYELNYEQIRRISFYNPTSYKRKVHISSSGNFAFIKTLDTSRSNVRSTQQGIDIEMLPGACTVLDFGYFEAD